jgi:magnesium transporter
MTYELLGNVLRRRETRVEDDALREFLENEHPADLAAFIGDLEPEEAWHLLDMLALGEQADIFGYLDHDFQVELAHHAPRKKLARLVTEMNADERADLYNELSEEQRDALMPALAQAEREDIRKLASYEEGTAGAIMTSDYATLPRSIKATEAIDRLRKEALDKETIYRAYVVDRDRRLVGSVRLQDLILAAPSETVADIMDTNTYAVLADEDQEVAARQIARYDMLALPVIDAEDKLLGIVTHDDALDVLQEEATEDFHRVGSVRDLDVNVREASIYTLYRARIVWLVVLVFGNIFSGAGIAYYEDTIAAFLGLLFFLPLLIASGGNAGSQSATLMVRALAVGDVQLTDWGRIVGREVLVAGLLGATMALAISSIGLLRTGVDITIVVALSMILIVIIGSIIGMALPLLLTRLNLDPATASAPLVTSICDVVGVLIYFGIATAVLFPAMST